MAVQCSKLEKKNFSTVAFSSHSFVTAMDILFVTTATVRYYCMLVTFATILVTVLSLAVVT